MNKDWILFIALFLLSASGYGEGGATDSHRLFQKAAQAAEAEARENQARSLWWMGATYVSKSSNPGKSLDLSFFDLDQVRALPDSKRTALFKDWPRLQSLLDLVDVKQIQSFETERVELQKQITENAKSNPKVICDWLVENRSTGAWKQDNVLDQLFGIDFVKTEKSIRAAEYGPSSIWLGQSKANTQTAWATIQTLLNEIKLEDRITFYDLGSGYGRVLLGGGCLFPKVQFKGVEIIRERAVHSQHAAERANLGNVKIYPKDVLDVDFSDGRVFYLFNPFPPIMGKVMAKLQIIGSKHKIQIITTGRTTGELAQVRWLQLKKSFPGTEGGLAIFESKGPPTISKDSE